MKPRTPLILACGSALLLSACAEYYPPPPPPPGFAHAHHVRWCLNHRPAYNPNTNVFIAPDGSPHYCVAPWER